MSTLSGDQSEKGKKEDQISITICPSSSSSSSTSIPNHDQNQNKNNVNEEMNNDPREKRKESESKKKDKGKGSKKKQNKKEKKGVNTSKSTHVKSLIDRNESGAEHEYDSQSSMSLLRDRTRLDSNPNGNLASSPSKSLSGERKLKATDRKSRASKGRGKREEAQSQEKEALEEYQDESSIGLKSIWKVEDDEVVKRKNSVYEFKMDKNSLTLPFEKYNYNPKNPVLYSKRWGILLLHFILLAVSQWNCFILTSIAPIANIVFRGHHLTNLVVVFLSANIGASLFQPEILKKIGLKNSIIVGCLLMATGTLLRSGIYFVFNTSFLTIQIGTIFCGMAQPFFQNTPGLFVSNWFPLNERTKALAFLISSTSVGAALSFLIGTSTVKYPEEAVPYLMCVAFGCLVLTILAIFIYDEEPPSPPTRSSLEQKHCKFLLKAQESHRSTLSSPRTSNNQSPSQTQGKINVFYNLTSGNFLRQGRKIFTTVPGFGKVALCYVVSDIIVNTMLTFLATLLHPLGYSGLNIGMIGACYQFFILFGAMFVAIYVDNTKKYRRTILNCFLAMCALLLCYSLDAVSLNDSLIIPLLFTLGLVSGPLEPILVDLAIDISFPAPENTILTILNILGSLGSAATLPLFQVFKNKSSNDYMPSLLFLLVLALFATVTYYTYEESLSRFAFDADEDAIEEDDGKSKGKILDKEYENEIDKVLGSNYQDYGREGGKGVKGGTKNNRDYLSYIDANKKKGFDV